MKNYQFDKLLTEKGWIDKAYVQLDEQGNLVRISNEKVRGDVERVKGFAIPGFQNAHSHAFQYAMAGLAEIHPDPSKSDDFWSWRDTMYRIALSIDPEQLEAIATMLYSEMLRHGFTSVAEFHYLHHDKSGKPFANKSEMGERLIRAAQKVGMNITLVPMFYQKGGFNKEPSESQRRFIYSTLEDYQLLLEASAASVAKYSFATLGTGIHSLRAVQSADIKRFFAEYTNELPFHIHIAEQQLEVKDCLAQWGRRPVEWLLENTPANEHFHLVHATHLTETETKRIAKSGAHVVLCPSTEGNLGDGIFPLRSFQEARGKWSIGTDSHIGLSPMEELRILDYGQRLTSHRRDQFVSKTNGDSGRFGFDMALQSGRAAMGNRATAYFEIGMPFDAVVLDAQQPLLSTAKDEYLLSTFIYAGDPSFLIGTITHGQWRIRDQRHVLRDAINSDFISSLKEIQIR
jgi:formimidoylglutamate deiminase